MAEFNFSIFDQALEDDADRSGLIETAVGVLHAAGEADHWHITTEGFWCGVTPHGSIQRRQGWKLHLSATVSSAEEVLARALPVLLTGCSAFKFARTLAHVAQLNARHTPRGHSGKFITVYPESDAEAIRLAEALHEATAGLAGPTILSDLPYAAGSLVHYRYGAFVEERRLSNDGLYSWVIFDPEGNPTEDRRGGTFQAPPWAPRLFPIATKNHPKENGTAGKKDDNKGVLIGDRFLVREAIRHSNKGGVYRAVDTKGGADAVIKEARPHVAADETGKDVRDLIRAEARALEKMGPLGVAPRLLKLFEQSQHVFLAEELVPGVPLRQWVHDEIRNAGWRRRVPEALEMARHVVELLDVAHQAGLILRDFNPNNIMVRPDGELRLIDLELAVTVEQQDDVAVRAGTPGFSAPEQLEGAPPAVEADYYSLGATLCFVVTGTAPSFLEDRPKVRSLRGRLADWLTVRGEAIDLPVEFHALILGLMDDEPAKRWTISAARCALTVIRQQPPVRQTRPGNGPDGTPLTGHQLPDHQWQEAVDGSVNYLLAAMKPADQERLWAASCAQGAPDPCILQLGAAGVLGVLTRYFELTGDQRLPEVITTAGQWIAQRMEVDAKRPPGLYFGEAGIAWSLYEAGRAVGDDCLIEQAFALTDTLPVSADNPDLTQGTAGIGLTFLHLWLRTHDEKFAQWAGKAADELVASVSEKPSGISWGAPAGSEWRLAGERYHGFAHGTAGVGYFLLAMALATDRADCLVLANQAGETLLANASFAQGTALWGSRVGDDPTAPYWCHGSAGIGSFLIRLHRATGDDRYAKMADLSARAVMENSWRGVLGQCHGLAGNGDFLLDMAETADGQPYEVMAHQLARVIFAERAYQDNWVVFPNEHGGLSPTWGDGMSGVLAFLLRLRYRSPRMWMVDQLLERSHR